MSHFVGVGLVLGFLLPHTSTALMLVNPLLCIVYQFFKQNRLFYKNNWIVCMPILLTLLINIPQEVSIKAIFSCLAILLYFFCFPMIGGVRIHNGYFWLILMVVFFTQLAYLLNVSILVSFLDTYYPIPEGETNGVEAMRAGINYENMWSFRMGGLYRNSNHCARYLTFLLAAFLILNKGKSIRKMLPFISICFFAVLLTGSRTGLVVISIIIIAYLFINEIISAKWKYGIVFVGMVGFLYLSSSGIYRSLNVAEGFENSANYKYYVFADYLKHEESLIRLLLGYLDEGRFQASVGFMKKFDSDYGCLVFQYGFVGFLAILLFFASLFRRMDNMGGIFLVLLLWMLTSTVVTSYRAFFVFMFLLSLIYNQHKKQLPN